MKKTINKLVTGRLVALLLSPGALGYLNTGPRCGLVGEDDDLSGGPRRPRDGCCLDGDGPLCLAAGTGCDFTTLPRPTCTVDCGGAGQPCCFAGLACSSPPSSVPPPSSSSCDCHCSAGLVYDLSTKTCVSCGGMDEPCCCDSSGFDRLLLLDDYYNNGGRSGGDDLGSPGDEPISVDFPDEDVRTILRSVADLNDLNVVIPDGLMGRTSIKLVNVTWQQLFNVVLDPLGYTFRMLGNIIFIEIEEEEEPLDRIFMVGVGLDNIQHLVGNGKCLSGCGAAGDDFDGILYCTGDRTCKPLPSSLLH